MVDTETQEPGTAERGKTFWTQPKTIPLLLCLIAHVCLNLGIATFLRVEGDGIAGVVVGSLFSQIVLISIWCAMSPHHLGTRYLAGTAAVAFTAICTFICAERDGGGVEVGITMTAAMFAQWLIYQMPLWYSRLKGWYLTTEDESQVPQERTANDLQFGIAQLLTWTTIVAIFLGVTRALIGGRRQNAGSMEVTMFLTLALGNSLLVLPLIYACFSRDRMWRWLGIAFGWAILVSIAQAIWLVSMGPPNVDDFLVLLNIAQFFVVLVTLMLVRLAGVRLSRHIDAVP